MLFTFALLIFLLSNSPLTFADEMAVELKDGHPQQYTVQKGDTLWDIAAKFLNDPWVWPEIWKKNQQIKNPDLIYPGDELSLVYIDGKPYITRDKNGKRTIRLSPETRIEDLDNAIPTIPLDIIAPYLTKNRILNAGEFNRLPYVGALNFQHVTAGTGDKLYAVGIPPDSNDKQFGIYRRGNIYTSPNSKKVLGYEATYIGEGDLKRVGNPSTIEITKLKIEIRKKDRVIPLVSDKVIDANFLPKASSVQRRGSIIGVLTNASHAGVNMVGTLDVVVVDVGLKDGVEKGDVFNIYSKGKVVKNPFYSDKQIKLPDEINGNLLIFRPFNRLSYAIVLDAQTPLEVNDIIHTPLVKL